MRSGCPILAIALALILVDSVSGTLLDDSFQQMQQLIENLYSRFDALYKNRCKTSDKKICSICSYDSCQYLAPDLVCAEHLPNPDCDSCYSQKGMLTNFTRTSIRLPNEVPFSMLSTFDKEMICITETLFDGMTDFVINGSIYYAYIGLQSGAFRQLPYYRYPFSLEGQCDNYDPRIRPWYRMATTGIKNYLILMDTSGSMIVGDKQSRLQLAKKLVKTFLGIITGDDMIGVVTFNSKATKFSPLLEFATEDLIARITLFIDQQYAYGLSNFTEAFHQAYQILNDSKEQDQFITCKTYVILITDGKPSETTDLDGLVQTLNAMNSGMQADIFAYTIMGASTKYTSWKLTCGNRGIWDNINSESDVQAKVDNFYSFIFMNNLRNFTSWTSPYVDDVTHTLVSSIVRPYYDSNYKYLVGVLSLDVNVDELLNYGTVEEIAKIMENSYKKCGQNIYSECILELFRPSSAKCSNTLTSACQYDQEQIYQTCPDTGRLDYSQVFCGRESSVAYAYNPFSCCGDSNCVESSALNPKPHTIAFLVLLLLSTLVQQLP